MRLHWPIFLCTRVARQSENHAVQKKCRRPWWQPDHQTQFKTTNLTSSLRQFWWCNTPCHYHGKVPRPSDCTETTSFKKTPIFTRIHGVHESPNFDTWQEKHGHFWPCQLRSLTPLILTECKRQGVYFSVKTMWVLAISPIFTQNCHKTLTIFHVIFPNAAQNMQQSTKKEGVSRP